MEQARVTEVAIKFKQAPFAMFRDTPIERSGACRRPGYDREAACALTASTLE
jgi:hypothetical protein